MEVRRVKLVFIDDLLGTQPSNKNIHRDYISSKAPNAESREEELKHIPEDELDEAVEEMTYKDMTIFHRDPETGCPEIPAYHIAGFFKNACKALRKADRTKSKNLPAYKQAIDLRVKVFPDWEDVTSRYIKIENTGEIGSCQRPLRASTPQGERVALANSECIHAGASIEFDIVVLESGLWDCIEEWLDYGKFNGLGQWRNSGKGAFVWSYC